MAPLVKLYSVVPHGIVIQVAVNCGEEEEEKEYFRNTRRLTAWEAYIRRTLAHVRVAEVSIALRSPCGNYRMKGNCKEKRCEVRCKALFV
jgi:hypothetical protein